MNPLTLEWIEKADGDFATAEREFRARKSPNFDAVCFHAQQCIEKYLKARLQEAPIRFDRTHNLIVLLELLLPIEPLWQSFRHSLIILTNYAVAFRYPGESAEKQDAHEALNFCRSLWKEIRQSLGL